MGEILCHIPSPCFLSGISVLQYVTVERVALLKPKLILVVCLKFGSRMLFDLKISPNLFYIC